jgi:HEPN domain-containing protein
MKTITREWLECAQDDIAVLAEIIESEHLTNMVAFHAQQAVEKSFKAIVEEFDLGFIRTHSLETLLERVRSHITTEVDMDIIKQLDEAYTSSRYPGDVGLLLYGKPTQKDASKFYAFAQNIVEMIRIRLEHITTNDESSDSIKTES